MAARISLTLCEKSMRRCFKSPLRCLRIQPKVVRNAVPVAEFSTTSIFKTDDRPVARYDIPDVKSLPEDLQARIQDVESKSGFLPNVFKVYSRRPAEFRAFFAYYDTLMEDRKGSNLTKADKEMIVVATSSANNCLYCVVAHSALHRIYSKNTILADQIATNWELAEITDRQKAILRFAMDVCHSETITEEHLEELEEHGLNKEDAWDIGAISALFALSNRMAHVTDMRPNNEFYLLGRVKKQKNMD